MTALPLKGNPEPAAFNANDAVTARLAVPKKSFAVTEPDETIILPVGTTSPFLAINSFAIFPLLHYPKVSFYCITTFYLLSYNALTAVFTMAQAGKANAETASEYGNTAPAMAAMGLTRANTFAAYGSGAANYAQAGKLSGETNFRGAMANSPYFGGGAPPSSSFKIIPPPAATAASRARRRVVNPNGSVSYNYV